MSSKIKVGDKGILYSPDHPMGRFSIYELVDLIIHYIDFEVKTRY